MTSPAVRVAAIAIAAVVATLAVVAVRIAVDGRDDLATAAACRDSGLPSTAVDFASRAARAYLPVGGVSRPAREMLRDLATAAGDDGDAALSLRAWQELRAAIRSTRTVATPDADLLEVADTAIARGMAAIDRLPDGRPGLDAAGHLAFLRRDSMPRPLPSLAAVVLFVAWLAVSAAGAYRSVTADGQPRWRTLLAWGAGSAALLAGWLVALSVA